MVKSQTDPKTGEVYPPFGVEGGTYEGAELDYRQYNTPETEKDAMYLIKANAPINTEAHAYVQTQLSSGRIKFLISENEAKVDLMAKKYGKEMTPEQRAQYLMPYTLTTVLREQMLNLVEENEGINVILKQNNKTIKKDKFSAFEYGMYYIKKQEENKRKRHHGVAGLMLFN